jgi:adenine-specific DNA methylase
MRFLPYIGSKRKLVNYVLESIGDSNKVLDLFSGSGVVAYHLKNKGKIV